MYVGQKDYIESQEAVDETPSDVPCFVSRGQKVKAG
jgi:hypothetical protein